jgi:hypothetical protein
VRRGSLNASPLLINKNLPGVLAITIPKGRTC